MARVVRVSITGASIADRITPNAQTKQVCVDFSFGDDAPKHGQERVPLAAAARRTARIAFETRAVAHEREISALLARLALVPLYARFADEI